MNVQEILDASLETLKAMGDRDILGVSKTDTDELVKKQFRRLTQGLHHDRPDYLTWDDAKKRELLTPRMDIVKDAYNRILDGNARTAGYSFYKQDNKYKPYSKKYEDWKKNKGDWQSYSNYGNDDCDEDYDSYKDDIVFVNKPNLVLDTELLIQIVSKFRTENINRVFSAVELTQMCDYDNPLQIRVVTKSGKVLTKIVRSFVFKIDAYCLHTLLTKPQASNWLSEVVLKAYPSLDDIPEYDRPTVNFAMEYSKVTLHPNLHTDLTAPCVLKTTVPLTVAMCGGFHSVKLSTEEILSVRVPAGTQHGSKLNLKGKGLPIFEVTGENNPLRISGYSDLRLEVNVEIPDVNKMSSDDLLQMVGSLLRMKSSEER